MSDEVLTCGPDAFCPAMDSKVNEANARQKGLSAVVVFNLATRTERCIGVAYKTHANDRGLMLNVCPWCAASLEINR